MTPVITTYTGRRVNPLDLRPEDICIRDIAHHLATINRFVGALIRPVNVAHHSYYVYKLVEGSGWEREALFHDAPEAYLGDMTKWVKHDPRMAAFREAEENAWQMICKALNLRSEHNSIIEEADRLMVRYEAMRENPSSCMFEMKGYEKPSEEEIKRVGRWQPLDWHSSEGIFLTTALDLGFKL